METKTNKELRNGTQIILVGVANKQLDQRLSTGDT